MSFTISACAIAPEGGEAGGCEMVYAWLGTKASSDAICISFRSCSDWVFVLGFLAQDIAVIVKFMSPFPSHVRAISHSGWRGNGS